MPSPANKNRKYPAEPLTPAEAERLVLIRWLREEQRGEGSVVDAGGLLGLAQRQVAVAALRALELVGAHADLGGSFLDPVADRLTRPSQDLGRHMRLRRRR